MTENIRDIVLGVLAAGVVASLGWFARTYLLRRRLRRTQRFFGLPPNSECLLVVKRDRATTEWSVARPDVYALLELSGLVRACGANADLVAHDETQQSFGERTEFCLGEPGANSRTAAHLRMLLPGVSVDGGDAGGERGAFTVAGKRYPVDEGAGEHVLLARLTAGGGEDTRPVFLIAGQSGVADQAAARYLARHQARLTRKYGRRGAFCLLLKVLNSRAYGPDVVELVGDVTRAATTPLPGPRSEPEQDPVAVRREAEKGAGRQSSDSSA